MHPVNEVAVFPVYVIISLSIFKRPYVSGNPVVWLTLITSSNAYVKDAKTTGDSGVVLFGAGTVCFSTKEILATVEIFFNDEILSAK